MPCTRNSQTFPFSIFELTQFYEVYSKFRLGEFASITMKAQQTALFPRLIGRNDTQSDFCEIWEGELQSGEEFSKVSTAASVYVSI